MPAPRSTTIALNVTEREVGHIGGDYTYYRDLLKLDPGELTFALLRASGRRTADSLKRLVAEKSCSGSLPPAIRRRLLISSRRANVFAANLRDLDADLVFSHIWFPVVRLGRHVPVLWSTQGISPPAYYEESGDKVEYDDVVELYRALGSRSDALVIWTESGARRLVHSLPWLEDKVHVLHPVISDTHPSLAPKPSISDRIVRLLFVGVDAERKGLAEVLSAYVSVRDSSTSMTLTVVARPPSHLVELMRAKPDIRFLPSGPGVDVKQLMAESDIFLLPTHADTYAHASVEAMAHGCAVLISDLDPLPEVVPDGRVGFVVPVGDAVTLAERLRTLVEHSALLRSMQQSARDLYLKRNSPSAFVAGLEKLAGLVLAEAGRP